MVRLDALKEWLLSVEETQLVELLDLTAEDIIHKFEERIIERRRFLEQEMEVLDSSMELEELDFEDD